MTIFRLDVASIDTPAVEYTAAREYTVGGFRIASPTSKAKTRGKAMFGGWKKEWAGR